MDPSTDLQDVTRKLDRLQQQNLWLKHRIMWHLVLGCIITPVCMLSALFEVGAVFERADAQKADQRRFEDLAAELRRQNATVGDSRLPVPLPGQSQVLRVASGWKANPVTVSFVTDPQKAFTTTGIDPAGDLVINLNPADVPDGMAAADVTLAITTPYSALPLAAFSAVDYDAKQHQLNIKNSDMLTSLTANFGPKYLNDLAHPKVPDTVIAQTLIDPLGGDKKTSLKKGLMLAVPLTIKWQQAPPPSASWVTDKVTVSYVFANNQFAPALTAPVAPATLAINLNPAADTSTFTSANVTLTLSKPTAAQIPLSGAFNAVNHVLTMNGGDLATAIFKLGKDLGADGTRPPAEVTIASAVVDPLDAAGKSLDKKVSVSDNLTIKWQKSP